MDTVIPTKLAPAPGTYQPKGQLIGGKWIGSIRHSQPERTMYLIAFNISRKSVVRLRPVLAAPGINGSIAAHSASVRSLG